MNSMRDFSNNEILWTLRLYILDIEFGIIILSDFLVSRDSILRYELRNVLGGLSIDLSQISNMTSKILSMRAHLDSVGVLEREIYEKLGIVFKGNDDMRGVFKDYGVNIGVKKVVDMRYNLSLSIIE